MKRRGGELVSISVDPVSRLKEERKGEPGIPSLLASDESRETIKTLKLVHNTLAKQISTPANILIDKDGVVRWAHYSSDMMDRLLPEDVLNEVNKL